MYVYIDAIYVCIHIDAIYVYTYMRLWTLEQDFEAFDLHSSGSYSLLHTSLDSPRCIHICVYTYMYTRIYIHIYVYTYMYTRICIHIYVYTYMYTHICIHIYVYTYMYTHICIHIYVYTYMYTHICIHIYVYTYMRLRIGDSNDFEPFDLHSGGSSSLLHTSNCVAVTVYYTHQTATTIIHRSLQDTGARFRGLWPALRRVRGHLRNGKGVVYYMFLRTKYTYFSENKMNVS